MTKTSNKPYKWLGLLALIPAQGLIFMDQTILPVALPTIQQEFGAGSLALEWSINSYLLLTAMFALAGGKIGDRFGSRRTFFIGLFFFTLSSCLAGFSQSMFSLIGWRALQGFGAALIIPSQITLFAALFPSRERGKATGINSGISSLFLIVGPLIGGYLTEASSWRWIFWINFPITLLAFILGKIFLPPHAPHPIKIDIFGLSAFAVCSGCTIIFFMQGREWGWLSYNILLILLIAAASLALIIQRERIAKQPSLDLSLFKQPVFAATNISICFIQFILMVTVFRAIYLQEVLKYTPSETGALTFVSCLPVLFLSPLGGILSDRFGPKLPISMGYLLVIFSFFLLGFDPLPSLGILILSLIAFGMGIPFIFTPSFSSAMKNVPQKKMGVAFGMLTTLRTLAASMGVALIGLFIDVVRDSRLNSLQNQPASEQLAQIFSFSAIHFVLAFFLIIAFAVTFVLHGGKSTHKLPDSPAQGWD